MMKGLRQWVLSAVLVCCLADAGWAQTYNGMHKYDGMHQNVVTGYMMLGDNISLVHSTARRTSTTTCCISATRNR